jgi:N-carbamoylputrescine amidase
MAEAQLATRTVTPPHREPGRFRRERLPDRCRARLALLRGPDGRAGHSIFVAAADRVGVERGQPFIGQSLIVSYVGWPIGGPATLDREEIIYADANLADARRKRNWNEFNQLLRDRRTDVYDEMLGAKVPRGWY